MQITNPSAAGSSYKVQPTGSNATYYSALRAITGSGTGQGTANQAFAYLVSVPGDCTLSATLFQGGAGVAGGLFYAGLYAADPVTGLPGALAFSLGEFNLAAAGTKSLAGVSVKAGTYWLFTQNKLITGATDFSTSTMRDGDNTMLIQAGASFNYLTSTVNAYAAAPANISAYTWTPTNGALGARVHFKIS